MKPNWRSQQERTPLVQGVRELMGEHHLAWEQRRELPQDPERAFAGLGPGEARNPGQPSGRALQPSQRAVA